MRSQPQFYSNLPLALAIVFTFFISVNVDAQRAGSYKCLEFDGVDDNGLISDDTTLNPRDAITVEAWIRPDSFSKNIWENTIFGKHGWGGGNGNVGYVLRCGDGGKVSFNVSGRASGGTWEEANSTNSYLKKGEWYHVAGTFDGDTVSVYVNGELAATHLYSGQIQVSSLDAKIGELANGTGRNFFGKIDEVRVWNVALSQKELRNNMCMKITSKHSKYNNLMGYWKLDEGSGSNIKDYSGQGNDGTLSNNGPSWTTSKAPLGDTAIWANNPSTLSLTSSEKDKFYFIKGSGNAGKVFLYVNNDTTESPANSNTQVRLDTTHYYGVFTTQKASFSVALSYKDHAINNTSDECGVDLLKKEIGGGGAWESGRPNIIASADSMVVSSTLRGEFMLGVYTFDTTSALTTDNGRKVICSNETLKLIAIGNDSAFTYKWYKDNKLISNANSSVYEARTKGSYYVDIQRDTTCRIKSRTIQIDVVQAPKVTLPSIPGVCVSEDTLKLRRGTPKAGVFEFKWLVSDSIVLPSRLGAGKYEIIYAYQDSTQCVGRDTQVLEVFGLPNVYFSRRLTICNNVDSLPLTTGVPSGGTYSGTGIVDNALVPIRFGRSPGKYAYYYSYTDKNGCSNETSDTFTILRTDNASLVPLGAVCENDAPVSLKAIPPGGNFAGKGVQGSTFDPSVFGAGKYKIWYEYTNGLGCTDADTQSFTVFKNTPVKWNYSLQACINSDTITPQEGTPSGGSFSGTGISQGKFIAANAGLGTHDIFYTYLDTNGCRNKAKSVAVVSDTTALSISDIITCINVDGPIDAVKPSGGTYIGKGVRNDSLFASELGEGSFKITYEFVDGCTSKAVVPVKVNPLPSVEIIAPGSICENESPIKIGTIPAKLDPPTKLSGNGTINGFFSPSFAGAGTHVLTLETTSVFGCYNSTTHEISVGEVPTATAMAYTSICTNDLPYKLDMGAEETQSSFYRINNNEVDTLHAKSWGPGSYKVEFVEVSTLGCRDSVEVDLNILDAPNKPIVSVQSNKLISSSSSGNQWYDAQGKIDGETNNSFAPPETGEYYVIVTNDSGCFAVSDKVQFQHVGIRQISDFGNEIQIFPNPTSGMIQVKHASGIAPNSISVKGIDGGEIMQIDDSHLDLSALSDGVYIVIVVYPEGTYVGRVILHRQ